MIVRVDTVVDWAGHRWTVECVIPEGVTLHSPGWLKRTSILSCVDNEGVGLPDRSWKRIVVGNMGGLPFQFEVERTIIASMESLVKGSRQELARIRSGRLTNHRSADKDGSQEQIEEGPKRNLLGIEEQAPPEE